MYKFIGIDISKQTFDVAYQKQEKWQLFQLSNTSKGFKSLLAHLNQADYVVMEASGPYYLPLASYLYNKGYKVVVENPLVIKRYSQMKLYRAKTDKKDAQTIAQYASSNQIKLWVPDSEIIIGLKQLQTAIEGIQKMILQAKNQLAAFKSSGVVEPTLAKELSKTIKCLENSKLALEKKQQAIVEAHYQQTMENVTSIPGIGNKTATMLTVITDNFTKFSCYKQLIAYVGFSPRIYHSGTSVRGKSHICKMGKAQIRKLLYMCTWTAKKYNKACREMYDRLKAKGKPERVIKIAIANKLIKQVFAIATSKKKYNENYQPNTCF